LGPAPYDAGLWLSYRREVWPVIAGRARADLPTPREQEVRLKVWESLRLAEREVLPEAERLLNDDLGRIVAHLLGDWRRPQEAGGGRGGGGGFGAGGEGGGWRRRPRGGGAAPPKPTDSAAAPALRDLAGRLFDAWLRSTGERRGGACSRPLIDGERTLPAR